MRLLAFLLEHAGEVVTREEVRDRLWPAEFVDFDHSLNTAVRKLRAALDDSADNPRFIETLSRRGYRFIAPVSWNVEPATKPVPVVPEPRVRSNVPAIVIAVLALAIVAGGLALFRRTRPAAPAKSVASVAVLPFINEDRDTQHMSDGVTEILIDTLSRLPDLRVMAPTTVFRYKAAGVDPKRAGKELGVDAVVVGHIGRQNDRYAVRVELIDPADGAQLWGDRFEVPVTELPSVQSRIADELSAKLRGTSRNGAIAARYTTTPEAYDLYTKGLYAWNLRGTDNLNSALRYFTEAARIDPKFAAAYAGLANTYGVMVGYGTISVTEGTTKIISNAQKALDLDPNNAEAYVSMATTKYRNVWDFPGAERDYKHALALNPNYATGHEWYADYLRSMGRWDEARREIELAHRLDPFAPAINTMMCFQLFYERRYKEAIAFAREAERRDPNLRSPVCVVSSLIELGDFDAALQNFHEAEHFRSHAGDISIDRPFQQILTDAYRRNGRRGFYLTWAKVMSNEQQQRGRLDLSVSIASAYAMAGERDQAFLWLEKAYERRVSRLTNINVEPKFDSIRDDPRFDDLLRRIGLPKVAPPPG
ncbi:MAG: winged helix-turn-helix domain-containing tetratricopeptide repeat protein [Thermoanaerobaculia bacterium]